MPPAVPAIQNVFGVLTSEHQEEFVVDLTPLEQVDAPGHDRSRSPTPAFGTDALTGRYRRH